ncbi:MAG: histidine kinase [Ignavibacteria bacterium]|nr:histidine kinase [Ignavibacteria bacterium]
MNVYFLVPKYLFTKRYARYVLLAAERRCSPSLRQHACTHHAAADAGLPGGFCPPCRRTSPAPPPKPLPVRVADDLLLALLIVGAGTASRLAAQWLAEESLRKDLEKEQLKTSLALLRHQVSPHFLMNTLNNIHALIDINPEHAKDAIVRLSTLMRYLLYDSARSAIPLRKEIEFLRSFITLMQLRFADTVDITVDVPRTIPDIEIPRCS